MSTLNLSYGSSNQTITISPASVTNNSAREATAIDNSSNKYIDALVQIKIKTGSSGAVSTGCILVYAGGSADGGTTYGDTLTGSDAAVTLTSPPGLRLIGVMPAVSNSTTYKSPPYSVAAAFGGILPDHWTICLVNLSGTTLSATGGDHGAWYQGIQATVA